MNAISPKVAWIALCLASCASAPHRPNLAPPADASAAAANDLAQRRRALNALLVEHWDFVQSDAPETASILGDRRWNDKSFDYSAQAVGPRLERTRQFFAKFEAIDTTGFSDQESLSKTLLVHDLRETLEEAPFEEWKMPANQMGGLHIRAAEMPQYLPFATSKDYDDYIARLRNLPKQFDDVIANMRLGMHARLMPPKFLLEPVAAQAAEIASTKPEASPFAAPLARMTNAISPADQARIRASFLSIIRDSVLPAYAKFADFVAKEYAPRGRPEPGVWALPHGHAYYATAVKHGTTTNLSPDEIHQIGLREVARIRGEMLAIVRRLGFSDIKAFATAVASNPRLHPSSREDILDDYRRYVANMTEALPKLFGRLPKASCQVQPIEAFRENNAAGAQYMMPSPDGSRPGRIQVNTGNFAVRTTLTHETTAYHEGVPGHHLHLAIQQELEGIPPYRRLRLAHNAYTEGWALYSEQLGKEIGFFQDPYNDYGRLEMDLLRAIRLVVDTGLHHKRWTRDQVVQFFHDNSTIEEVEVQSETNRYMVWPGQALGYKIGQLAILGLRRRATQELGANFDLRKFHDVVLGSGSLPLDILEARIKQWIATQKTASSSPPPPKAGPV